MHPIKNSIYHTNSDGHILVDITHYRRTDVYLLIHAPVDKHRTTLDSAFICTSNRAFSTVEISVEIPELVAIFSQLSHIL